MGSAENAGYGGGGSLSGAHGTAATAAPTTKEKMQTLLNTGAVQITLIVSTFVPLFSEDVRLLMGQGADPPMYAVIVIVFVLFSAKLAYTIYINKREKCGPPFLDNKFYTFLDFVATASLIMDFWFVQEAMAADLLADHVADPVESDTPRVEDNAVLTHASRAARAGTKIGRLLKLTRLMRISKLVSLCSKTKAVDESELEQPSDMSRRMAEIITGKVILIVLVMLFAMPYLENETIDAFPSYGLTIVELPSNLSSSSGTLNLAASQAAALKYVNQTGKNPDRLILVSCGSEEVFKHLDYDTLKADARDDFLSDFATTTINGCRAVWDDSSAIREESAYSIMRTWFVVIMLGVGSVLFGKDATFLSERITIPLGVLSADMAKVSALEMDEIEQFHSNVREVNLLQDSF
jgi:hypothetical protein